MLRCQWRSLGGPGTKVIVPWELGLQLWWGPGVLCGVWDQQESGVESQESPRLIMGARLADSRRPTRLTDLVNCIVFQLKFVLIEQTARQSRQILPSLAWRDP